MNIKLTDKKYRVNEQPGDYSFWKYKTHQERIDALEQIREEYNSWRYNAEQRFQRIYRVTKQK